MVDEVVKGRKGEPIGITLPGGGSMGYLWTAEAAGDVAVSEGIVAQSEGRGLGGRPDVRFDVTLSRAGTRVVVFRLKRPWEKRATETRRIRFEAS